MKKEFREALEDSPVIAAIKDDAGLEKCLTCDSRINLYSLWGCDHDSKDCGPGSDPPEKSPWYILI